MKESFKKNLIGWSSVLCLTGMPLLAQEANETEALRRQLRQATESFEKALQENRKVIDALSNRLELLEKKNLANQPVVAAPTAQVIPQTPPASLPSGGS